MTHISSKGRNCDPSNNKPSNSEQLYTRQRKRESRRRMARESVAKRFHNITGRGVNWAEGMTRKAARLIASRLAND